MFRPHAFTEVLPGPSFSGRGIAEASARPELRKFVPKIETISPAVAGLFGAGVKLAALTTPPAFNVGGPTLTWLSTTWKASTQMPTPPELVLLVPVASIATVCGPAARPLARQAGNSASAAGWY